MLNVIGRIAPQVDHLFVCLNEYESKPSELGAFRNVTAIIPRQNWKDVGKFIFPTDDSDIVFTIDDDILYPRNYVEYTLSHALKP